MESASSTWAEGQRPPAMPDPDYRALAALLRELGHAAEAGREVADETADRLVKEHETWATAWRDLLGRLEAGEAPGEADRESLAALRRFGGRAPAVAAQHAEARARIEEASDALGSRASPREVLRLLDLARPPGRPREDGVALAYLEERARGLDALAAYDALVRGGHGASAEAVYRTLARRRREICGRLNALEAEHANRLAAAPDLTPSAELRELRLLARGLERLPSPWTKPESLPS